APVRARDGPGTPGQHPAAAPRPAPAARAVAPIFLHRPVVRQLFAGANVAERDHHDLAANAEIGRAGVVDENLVASYLGGRARAEKEAVRDLDVRGRDAALDLRDRRWVVDVPAFDGHGLAAADAPSREQALALDRARTDACFR